MSIGIFGLTARHAEWTALRRAVVAENIANANTPAYKSKGTSEFQNTLDRASAGMSRNHPQHIADESAVGEVLVDAAPATEIHHSGNNVSIERELMTMNDVSRQHTMNAAIVRSFHRMYINTLKG